MKKIILVLLAAAGMASTGYAQGTRLGLKAGASLTNFVGEDSDGLANKFGVHGGFVAELSITDNFAVQPEVLFSMKGAQDEDDSGTSFNQSYIDIPILFKIRADGLFFELGPQIGLLIGSKAKFDELSFDTKDDFKTIDFGYAAGLGYEFSSGPIAGLRHNGGISNVGKDRSINGFDFKAGKVYNSAFQLYVGYMFGGK